MNKGLLAVGDAGAYATNLLYSTRLCACWCTGLHIGVIVSHRRVRVVPLQWPTQTLRSLLPELDSEAADLLGRMLVRRSISCACAHDDH